MAGIYKEAIFEGKVAFIAGGSSGINLRIAQRLAELGARVSIISRSEDKVQAAVDSIVSVGGTAFGQSADVRDPEAVAKALHATAEQYDEIDILVSGAAGNFVATALDMSPNAFKTVVDIDLLGTFNVLRIGFEHLRKPGASIINISAGQAFVPMIGQSHVGSAKAGVDMLTKNLAMEWGPSGVRVNSIVPGPIEDTEGMARLASNEKIKQAFKQTVPLRRYGSKDEIADLAVFLSSDAAAYITGAIVVCDGGQTLCGSGGVNVG